jgi:Dockerin type I domain
MKKIKQTDFTYYRFLPILFPLFLMTFKTTAQTLSCVGSVSVALEEDCRKEVSPQLLLRGSNLGNFNDYQVTLAFGPNTYADNFVSARDIYRYVSAKVTHKVTGSYCTSSVLTRDTIPPKMESPKDTIIHCSQVDANGAPLIRYTGEPKTLFDCSPVGIKYMYTDDIFYANCFFPFAQTPFAFPSDLTFNAAKAAGCSRVYVRNFVVRDTFDNKTLCRQVIYMKDAQYSDIIYTSVSVKYCNGTPLNTEPDSVLINGVKIAGTGRPYYKTGLPLTSGLCLTNATWQDTEIQLTNEYKTIKRVWTLTNPCQYRTDTSVQTIYIYEGIPNIVCKPATTIQMNDTKSVTVKALQMVADFSDQCTPKEKLLLGIRKIGEGTGFPLKDSVSFGCDDTLTNTVELWVKDEMGRTSSCNSTIRIIDTLYICSPRPLSIEGKLNRENTTAIKAQVVLSDLKSGLQLAQPLASDFKFLVVKRDATYKITPTRPKDWYNGVTTYDIALISRHILDIEPLTSPYKIIAADVNGDGEISAADMLFMRRLVLRQIDSVPRSQPWRFVPTSYVFADPLDALNANYPQFLMYDHPTDNINNANFLAIKTGDVNLSAKETALIQAEVRGEMPSLNFTVKKDKTGNIIVSSDEMSIEGFQMTLNFDKTMADIESLESLGLKDFNDNNYAIFKEKSKITVSWNGKMQKGDLFKIKLKTLTAQTVQDIIQITSDMTDAEAYIADGGIRIIKMLPKAENTLASDSVAIELLPNVPNPFSDETTIRFNLSENDEIQLSIFDNQGRVIKTVKKLFQKGYNDVKIPFYDVPMGLKASIFSYKIQTTHQTLVGRMVFMK